MINQAFIEELKHESIATRKTLERIPVEQGLFRPHEKSQEMGMLANHLADLMAWIPYVINQSELDFKKGSYVPGKLEDSSALLKKFDQHVADAYKALEGVTNEQLMEPWTLRAGDHIIFTLPKVVALRSFVFNHSIHHRAQLGVYLRLNNIPVPSVYGPSADEMN